MGKLPNSSLTTDKERKMSLIISTSVPLTHTGMCGLVVSVLIPLMFTAFYLVDQSTFLSCGGRYSIKSVLKFGFDNM